MAEIDRVITGIPLWLMRNYIVDSGGSVAGSDPGEHESVATQISGSGWHASLVPAPDQVVGSLRIGQVRLTITGSAAGVATIWGALEPRLVRAGG